MIKGEDYVEYFCIAEANDIFYFQTDKKSRKYEQLKNNVNIALCIDNIQIEGVCKELGHPLDNPEFCELFLNYFKGSYDAYSFLHDERVFEVKPVLIQKWIYENAKPFIEVYDFEKKVYRKKPYIG
ncbi:pyridoxamine 5'-phosphate oxidase family protein [Tissierella sp. Yu-01]|uniref:pyridoxamine 5'-phosphate oxidase family protein n=1 Tax=Tissierella sp. Yu-01 TaxID=3035694 RepID=UPI00240D2887|nr:pyridoxamine 5'-phosphate oxidase family protein [Tissierella sp. Yu-01]WFA08941.1 pyridoxamine 5'-phosphate oxidase family protein [Tissierella sp. Yu-01]